MAPIPQDVDVTDPSFDPSSLTVAQLRSFLQHQGVILPSTARKPALIQAFREQVDSMGSGGQGSTRVSVSSHRSTEQEGRDKDEAASSGRHTKAQRGEQLF